MGDTIRYCGGTTVLSEDTINTFEFWGCCVRYCGECNQYCGGYYQQCGGYSVVLWRETTSSTVDNTSKVLMICPTVLGSSHSIDVWWYPSSVLMLFLHSNAQTPPSKVFLLSNDICRAHSLAISYQQLKTSVTEVHNTNDAVDTGNCSSMNSSTKLRG